MKLYALALLSLLPCISNAADSSIEARTFDVTVERVSTSGNVTLFKPGEGQSSRVGKIVLLRTGLTGPNQMAFRILRTYTDGRFAGRWVRKYGQERLELNSTFTAIEKVRDLADTRTPEEKVSDGRELMELEDLMEAEDGIKLQTEDSDISLEKITVQEHEAIDHDSHWISPQLGLLRVIDSEDAATQYAAYGVRYAFTIARGVVTSAARADDSITPEFGALFFNVADYDISDNVLDSFSLATFMFTLRYNLFLGESFVPFLYGGLYATWVYSSEQSTPELVDKIQQVLPAIGLGAALQIGPKWFLRGDVGLDFLGVGLALRF